MKIRNPEEHAAAQKALTWLARICADHRKELLNDRSTENEADKQFLWGQNFFKTPEVWEEDGDPEGM